MKSLLLKSFLFLMLFGANEIFAQNARFGLRVGPNFSTTRASNDNVLNDATDYRVGYHIAFVPEIVLAKIYSIQPELNFMQKGYKIDGNREYVFNYFETQVLSKFTVGGENLVGFFSLGPSFGFFNSGHKTISGNKETIRAGIGEDYRRLELGFVFGAGLGINMGVNQLFFDIRYMSGITAVDDGIFDSRLDNRGIAVGIGYTFGVGGGLED